jgi:NitT/TauT family transport system ATP-binding protein
MTASLSGRGVSHSFDGLKVLGGLDFEVSGGETLALVGPSGCGKSTLLELICGLADPASGAIEVSGGEAASVRLSSCALMPQSDCLLPWFSAIDNAGLGLTNQGMSKARARREAAPMLERIGLTGFEQSRPRELSGGMRQRVAFARTLLSAKPVLLLDEPFASLDAITRAELQEWLLPMLADNRHTVVLVTHDVEEALYLADRVAVLSARPGRVIETIESPPAPAGAGRSAAVSEPGFVALRERILERLADESRMTGPTPDGPPVTGGDRPAAGHHQAEGRPEGPRRGGQA